MSYPLTAHFGVPHGLACAFTMPAVLRHNLINDDGRFMRLAKVFSPEGLARNEDLLYLFDGLNQQLQVAKQVREMVGSLDAIISLREEMLTPGRADNALVDVNNMIVSSILKDSWLYC
jgi:alcohol dehydrogenase